MPSYKFWGIRQKGTLLVAVPLAIQACLLLWLLSLVLENRNQNKELLVSKEIIALADDGMIHSFESVWGFLSFYSSHSLEFIPEYKRKRELAAADFEKLGELIDDNRFNRKDFLAVDKAQKVFFKQFDKLINATAQEAGNTDWNGNSLSVEMQKKIDTYGQALKAFVSTEKQYSEDLLSLNAGTERLAAIVGSLFLALNTCFALCFIFIFLKGLVERIEKVRQNALLLASDRPITEVVKGSDEISQLDLSIRQVAEVLSDARMLERAFIDENKDLIFSVDEPLRLREIAPSVESILGYDPDHLIGERASDLIVDSNKKIFQDTIKKAFSAKSHGELDIAFSNSEGDEIVFLLSYFWSGTSNLVNCIAHDINERKLLEQKLKDSEEIISAILEQLPTAVFTLADDGKVIGINRAAEEMLRTERRNILDRPFVDLLHRDELITSKSLDKRNSFEHIFTRLFAGELVELEFRNEQTLVPVSIETKGVRAKIKGLDTLILGAIDVSSRKEAERLKQEFVAMISHDLRTPLTSIQSFLDNLARQSYGRLEEPAKEPLNLVRDSVSRLIRLVSDLLEMEKNQLSVAQLNMAKCTVQELISTSVNAVAHLAEEQQVYITVSSPAVDLLVDGDRIIRVIINLLSNAIKFSKPEDTVKIECRQLRQDLVELSVIDSGPGITAADTRMIFEKFRQVGDTKKQSQGSGLGLAICKAIIDAHGGKIGVESEVGSGSRFWIQLKL